VIKWLIDRRLFLYENNDCAYHKQRMFQRFNRKIKF
jgi:hypothetical protein